MTDTATVTTPHENILAWAAKHGITMTAAFVPWSQSRNAGEKRPSLNWRVTLHKAGRAILTTDYSAGSAHCPAYKASVKAMGGHDSVLRHECIAWECEHGRPAAWYANSAGPALGSSKAPILPDLADVLSSLSNDAYVLSYNDFEQWASMTGYDPDSRKAERVYQACLAIALTMRNGLGESAMGELAEACQDY